MFRALLQHVRRVSLLPATKFHVANSIDRRNCFPELRRIFIVKRSHTNIVRFKGQAAAKTFTGKSVELIAQSFGTPTPNASTLVNVQGVESGLVSVVNITVVADTTGTGDAQGTQAPTNTTTTGGDTTGGNTTGGGGGVTYGGGPRNV